MASFEHYLGLQGIEITRAMAEERMLEKLNRSLTEDITPLLPAGVNFNDAQAMGAFERIWSELISRIKGNRGNSRPGTSRRFEQQFLVSSRGAAASRAFPKTKLAEW